MLSFLGGGHGALLKAVQTETHGGAAKWPSGQSAALVRQLLGELKAAQARAADAEQALADGQAQLLRARAQIDSCMHTGTALWHVPALDPQQPLAAAAVEWSPAVADLLGESGGNLAPVLGTWLERIHQDDREPLRQAMQAHLAAPAGQHGLSLEHRLRHGDGGWHWVRLQLAPAKAVDGGRLQLAGCLTDIDEQRRIGQVLDVTQTRFELGAMMLNDGLWDMSVIAGDPINPSNVFWWSDQVRALLGFQDERDFPDVLDSWASRLHPEDKERALTAFAAHISDRSGRTPFDIEYRLQRKDGNYRWFRARGQTKRAADGTPLRAVGALLDIDAQIQLAAVIKSLTATSAELVDSNHDLSRRTEQQASALEETASSMEEMTSTVQQNAEGARRAAALASEAAAAAETGRGLVAGIVGTMAEIEQSSSRIGEIISVIDSIAFQTNILALNAAVEAARAGEQGRGFAVVASEVRALAQRCAAAAKEIKDLIQDSGDKVDRGSEQSKVAGEHINSLRQSVAAVDAIVAEIAAASGEQSAGIGQINHSIMQMDTMTQQNAALVEEMAAAVDTMRTQTALLEDSASSSSLRAS